MSMLFTMVRGFRALRAVRAAKTDSRLNEAFEAYQKASNLRDWDLAIASVRF